MRRKKYEIKKMNRRRKSGHSVRRSQDAKGEAEICREQEIIQALYYKWRDKFADVEPELLLIATLMKPDTRQK